MRVDDNILKSVVFLGYPTGPYTDDISDEELGKLVHWCGTGFIVSTTSPCGRQAYCYIVTAKHVALPLEGARASSE